MILRTRGGDRDVRTAGDLVPSPGAGAGYGTAVSVSQRAAGGIPAFDAAIRIASQAVAGLRMCMWRGDGADRTRITSTKQARFLAGEPNTDQSWFAFWEIVEASLTARRNAYVWRDELDGQVVALWALHPDQVMVRLAGSEVRYSVGVGMGYTEPLGPAPAGIVDLPPQRVLHIRGPGGAGMLVAPTPVDVFRTTFGAALAREQWEEGFYRRATGGGVVLSFPLELTEPQAQQAQQMWDASGGGIENAHGTRVVSGGATVTPVGISQRDAQFVEAVGMTSDQIALITGVPSSMLGGGAGVGQRGGPISPEHESTRWFRYGLLPRLDRIEAAVSRDRWWSGGRDRPEFDREGLIAADLATRADVDIKYVQSGIDLVDEVRAARGKPPLPNGAGQIPQIVPVGGSPHGVPDPQADPPTVDTNP